MHLVSILQLPHPLSFGFIVLEFALEVGSIRIGPFAFKELILIPLTNVLHTGGREYICSMTMLFAILPLS